MWSEELQQRVSLLITCFERKWKSNGGVVVKALLGALFGYCRRITKYCINSVNVGLKGENI